MDKNGHLLDKLANDARTLLLTLLLTNWSENVMYSLSVHESNYIFVNSPNVI